MSSNETSGQDIEKAMAEKAKDLFKFDSIETLGSAHNQEGGRYFKAKRGNETFFVKSSHHDLSSEFKFSKIVYAKDKKHFIEPVDFKKADLNYFVARWNSGTDLEKYLKQNPSEKEKESFLDDLAAIYKALWDCEIVHRDLIPRNFMVVDDHLVLVDLYWAVSANYDAEDQAKDNLHILTLHYLGENFAEKTYKWDDAYSFVKIAEHVVGKEKAKKNPGIQQIAKNIGKRVITPDPAAFYEYVTQQAQHINNQADLLTAQQARIAELEQQHSDILNSKSYKIGRKATAPYRAIKRQK